MRCSLIARVSCWLLCVLLFVVRLFVVACCRLVDVVWGLLFTGVVNCLLLFVLVRWLMCIDVCCLLVLAMLFSLCCCSGMLLAVVCLLMYVVCWLLLAVCW